MNLPAVAPVHQHLTADHIADPVAHVRTQLRALPLSDRVRPGMRVAVGVGSRGIACIREVVAPLIAELRELGAAPFLVPAMGSHGSSSAEGQAEVLVGYGLGDLGAPILSDMTPVEIGVAPDGMPVYWDRNAAGADAVIVVNRIKPHTSFRNRWESGLMKMLAVGFGKAQGASMIHGWGVSDAMPKAARVALATMPVIAGIGIVENGLHQPATIEVIPGEAIEAREPALLELAWTHLPRIPLEPIDLLVLQEIGKDISGTGMDLNVVGMWRRTGGQPTPDIRCITALDLTPNSHGNGIGVGYCDAIPRRLADQIDLAATYANCLTSSNYNGGKVPITLPTDQAVIEATLPRTNPAGARLVIARNTLDLGLLWVSTAQLDQLQPVPKQEQNGQPQPQLLDTSG